jgi:hypothetical protein
MAAIITSKFRIHNAQSFQEGFSEAAATNIYLGIGRPQAWTDDNSPDTPKDTVSGEFYRWDDMIALKRVQSSDVTLAIPRRNWTSGKYYDIYKDNYNGTTAGVNIDSGAGTTPATITDANFFVVTDEYNVYKCIDNNGGAQSTTKPTGTGTTIISTADSYRWKYMYTVSPADVLKFVSTDFIPAKKVITNPGSTDPYYNQYLVEQAAVDGKLEHVVISAAGTSYSSAPTVTITGDGSSAAGTATIDVGSGTVTGITLSNGGSGYTFANIALSGGGGSGATASAIVSPKGGHGANAEEELGAFYAMMNVRLEYADGTGDFPVDNDYRRITLVRDPYNFGGTVVASATTLSSTKSMSFTSLSGGTLVVDRTFAGGTSNAIGRIISIDTGTSTIRYIQTATDNPTGVNFQSAETITMNDAAGSATGITFTSATLNNPEVQPDSGDMLYVENRRPINRASDQIEDIKIIVEM